MKKISSLIIFGCIMIAAIAQNNAEPLKLADLAFNQLCQEKGMKFSFLEFADDNVIKLTNKAFASRGKAALEKEFGDEVQDFKLEWKPDFAEMAASGDLGYTFGNWRLTLSDGTVRYGEYMTVWKKQADGSWKYVMDGGNGTPDNPEIWK
jgi:ketosteroid isomerase-like protein